jgi:hypothetical protein
VALRWQETVLRRRCGRKVLQLFAPGRHSWRCRHCYNLTYASRQVGLRFRLILKGEKIRERLRGELAVSSPLPGKPKACTGGDTSAFAHGTIRRWSKSRAAKDLERERLRRGKLPIDPSFRDQRKCSPRAERSDLPIVYFHIVTEATRVSTALRPYKGPDGHA